MYLHPAKCILYFGLLCIVIYLVFLFVFVFILLIFLLLVQSVHIEASPQELGYFRNGLALLYLTNKASILIKLALLVVLHDVIHASLGPSIEHPLLEVIIITISTSSTSHHLAFTRQFRSISLEVRLISSAYRRHRRRQLSYEAVHITYVKAS